MEFSLILLKKSIVLILMVFMGFLSVRNGHVRSQDSKVISQLCFDWVIPMSLINAFLIDYTPEASRNFRFACLSALTLVLLFVGITLLLRRSLSLTPSEQGSLMFTNSAGITLPLASALLGNTGVLLCAPHMGIQNFLMFTLLTAIMSGETKIPWKTILLNRNILAILSGIIIFLFRIPIPALLKDTISGVGSMISPLSMFMIGMLIGETDLLKLLRSRELYRITGLRLLVWPALTVALIAASGITRRFPFTRNILLVMVMCIASPTATMVTQFASAYRSMDEARKAGSLNVITTLLGVITIPLWVFIYQLIC